MSNSSQTTRKPLDRRTFNLAAGASVLAAGTARAARLDSAEVIVGEGEYQYKVQHQWPQLPDQYSWQTTHNVAVDEAQNLYVIHEGKRNLEDHPSIFVFDPSGKFIRAFGWQFQGGGHGLEVRKEGNEEFLYVSAYQGRKCFAKLTLAGDVIWQRFAPMQSGVYAKGEAANPQKTWGRDRFMPTNFAFLPDGGFLLTDGYGAYCVHRYDQHGNWLGHFGGAGEGQGTFNLPHGIWIDDRAEEPVVVVADRAHNTLQRLTLEGKYIDTIRGFGLPANVDTHGKLMLVPELVARVSLLGPDNQVVAQLGEDVKRVSADTKRTIRADESAWQPGKFVHPHDACFGSDGSIYVAEWVATGRITKLTPA